MPKALPELRFHCEVLTPMFLYGFYPPPRGAGPPAQLELREESIVGLLRYWYRAVHPTIDTARPKEAMLFGNSDQRGLLNFLVYLNYTEKGAALNYRDTKQVLAGEERMIPGKTGLGGDIAYPALRPSVEFRVSIAFRNHFTIQQQSVRALVLLASFLGGLGRRARRGMGSFQVIATTQAMEPGPGMQEQSPVFTNRSAFLGYLLKLLNQLVPGQFIRIDDHIERHQSTTPTKPNLIFPCIQRIWIGQYPKTLREIYEATHTVNLQYGVNYGMAMGRVQGGRYASPMYTSLVQINGSMYPVITELASPYSGSDIRDIREAYLNKLEVFDID